MRGVLVREEIQKTEIYGRMPCEDRNRDWTTQAISKTTTSTRN
jgi:hypothetical protein